MSGPVTPSPRETLGRGSLGRPDPLRALAVGGAALLLASYLSVLHSAADVVGEGSSLLFLAAGTLVAATLLARVLDERPAAALAALLLTAGGAWYMLALPSGVGLLLTSAGRLLGDVAALLTGLSVLRITEVGTWALAFTPAPTFLSWYLVVRRRYAPGVAVGGATLGFFVLTGDASIPVTLLGVIGAAATVGFGDLERRDGTVAAAEVVAVVLAAMVAVPLVVSVVPGGATQPLAPGSRSATVESSIVNADERVSILGSIRLSPQVRFTVESTEPTYWRVGAYDRYTGDDWIRTGETRAYSGRLSGPPGASRRIRQTYVPNDDLGVMPAAWRPVEVVGEVAGRTHVTELGGLVPGGAIDEDDAYTVESREPTVTPERLRTAGREYPRSVRERYLQIPESTPDRVAERTARITANADNPYDTARVIAQWLRNNKDYSLTVRRPNGNIADSFLFEMDAGYCTYFATTMVAMLRTQDIPARFVVGYTPGERVDKNRWVVRGYDSHAWVEVYFPGVGWVRFDPTPSEPRRTAEQSRLEAARQAGQENVDTNETGDEWTPAPPGAGIDDGNASVSEGQINPVVGDEALLNQSNAGTGVGDVTPAAEDAERTDGRTGGAGDGLPALPSREQAALGAIVLAGLAAGVHRSGATERAYRTAWLRWQPREDPAADIERAYRRLEYLLGRIHRPRRPGETPREYIDALPYRYDDRVARVAAIYERSRYAGRRSEAAADEAVELVDELVYERTPLLRRLT